jgi:ABC-type polysaccharide/polyol phosphate export permease
LYLLMYMAISLLSFVGISLAVAGISFWIKRSELLFDITRLSLMIMSGALFSPEIFPAIFRSLAYIFPPAVYIELSRSVILFSIYPSFGIMLNYFLLSLAYLIAGIIIFSLLLKRARKTGRITLL